MTLISNYDITITMKIIQYVLVFLYKVYNAVCLRLQLNLLEILEFTFIHHSFSSCNRASE